MSAIRKSLIKRVAAWYLLGDAVNSACRWGPGQKVTDEERRVASIAALEARTKQTAMPVSMEEGWRAWVPTPEELDADVRKLAGVIALHGVEVLKHPDQFAEAMKAKGLQEQIKKLEAEVARLKGLKP